MNDHRWTNLWAVGLSAATVLLTLGVLSPASARRMYAQVDVTTTAVVYLPQIQSKPQNTGTPTAAMTPTGTATPPQTTTATSSSTPTYTATGTATPTHTASATGAPTHTATPTPTTTPTATATATPTQSATPIPPLRMAVIGDFGMNNSAEADVANLVAGWHPDAVVTTGDNNYPAGAAETLDANVGQFYHAFISPYLGIYGAGAATNRFFPVLGNHDWYAATGAPPLPNPYLAYFGLPSGPGQERYYDVVLGPIHLFALDSDPNEPDGITSTSVQADWLRTALAASTAPWKLVFLHHPPFHRRLCMVRRPHSSGPLRRGAPPLSWQGTTTPMSGLCKMACPISSTGSAARRFMRWGRRSPAARCASMPTTAQC